MKLVITFIFGIIMLAGLFNNPVFVVAGGTCYVDKDADDDGDGSDDEPYQKIKKAIDKGCKKIIVKKGTYKDEITLGKGIKVEGKNKDDVIISGKVTMKDGSSLDNVTVSGFGIDVDDGADAEITNSKITGANIGIETSGGGTLTVKDVNLFGNKKGMYLQKGKNVHITETQVNDNDEEGIDIRANVDGIISGNSIFGNGESGIEVILGKSDLKIIDNKIKKNGASGIAAQYYKESSSLGGVKIKDNTITYNKDYGINCKAPSGGNPGKDYWTKSLEMLANKVYSNKDGEFSATCHFDAKIEDNATKTEKEILQGQEMDLQQKEEQEKLRQQQKEENKAEVEKQKEQENQKQQKQDDMRSKLQDEKNFQRDIEKITREVESLYNEDTISKEKIKSRPSIFMFFIGPDYTELKNIAYNLSSYDEQIEKANQAKSNISDKMILERVDENIAAMVNSKQDMYEVATEYNDTFSLFGWAFKDA